MSARASYVAAFLTTLALTATSIGCELENPGDEPPVGNLYFPNALALSNEGPGVAPRFLFVASTNFDLRYTAGALHAFSLDAIDTLIGDCEDLGTLGAESCVIELKSKSCEQDGEGCVLADEVFIPTYATALALDPDGKRIVVSSRTEDRLSVIDVDLDADDAALAGSSNPVPSSLLGCEAASSRSCNSGTTAGLDYVTAESLDQPDAPSDLIVGRLSELTDDPADDAFDYVATAHQRGAVSLYVEDTDTNVLQLGAVIEGLGGKPTGIARDPVSGLLHVTILGNQLVRVGVNVDDVDSLNNSRAIRLFNVDPVQLTGGSLSALRSIAFLNEPIGIGVGPDQSQALIIANNPSALVLANVTPGAGATTTGSVQRIAEIGGGGAKLALGSIGGRPLAAVSCLDGRSVYIVDLTSMETRAVVPNLSGPYGVAFDEARARLYVTDFRSSVIRIVDLSQLASRDAAPESVRVVATLGRPRLVQELK